MEIGLPRVAASYHLDEFLDIKGQSEPNDWEEMDNHFKEEFYRKTFHLEPFYEDNVGDVVNHNPEITSDLDSELLDSDNKHRIGVCYVWKLG